MWKGDEYVYSKKILKKVAGNYEHIYDRIVLAVYTVILDGYKVEREWCIRGEQVLIEYKADFDMALNELGKGRWTGEIEGCEFRDFRYFGRLQQVVIADVYGIDDATLEDMGFYNIPKLRGLAYWRMTQLLNGKELFP